MLKKLGVLLLTGIMVAGLSACSTSTTTPDTSADTSADTSTNSEATSTYTYDKEYQFAAPVSGDQVAIFKTTMGDITVKLFPNDAPKAVENFVTHAQNGYYDGLSFHRVINDFMIQGGDPAGDGTGGESIWGTAFEDELTPNLHNFRGALSMANSGANTNGSQFFIVQTNSISESYIDSILEYRAENETAPVNQLADGTIVNFGDIFNDDVLARFKEVGGTPHLDYAHTVFGQVVEGMDIVDAIAATETDANDKPVTPIMVNTIEIKTID